MILYRSQWPDNDPVLRDLRFAQRLGLVDPDDRPAAMGWVADPDGSVHPAPLTVDDVAAWIVALMSEQE